MDLDLEVKSAAAYGRLIRGLVRGLWNGRFDFFTFYDDMVVTIQNGLTRAWTEGMRACGIEPEEMTEDERELLQRQILSDASHITGFAQAIIRNSRASGGKLSPLLRRAGLWENRYGAVRELARSSACKDKKLEWVMGARERHCSDCLRLNGRVYRASIWRKYGLYPKSPDLECRGFRCGCEFVETNKRATPGFPPRPFYRR